MSSSFLSEEDKARLEFTINTRLGIINKIMEKGELPKDQGNQIMLMQALSDTDTTILKRAKLIIEDEKTKTSGEVAIAIANILKQTKVNRHGVIRTTGTTLPDTVPNAEIKPGEFENSADKLNYDKFLAQTSDDK